MAGKFSIDEGSTERFVIDNGGNIGIGTTGPLEKLHVAGGGIRADNALMDSNVAYYDGDPGVSQYLLLAQEEENHKLVGKIYGVRGGTGAHARAWQVDISIDLAADGNDNWNIMKAFSANGVTGFTLTKILLENDGADENWIALKTPSSVENQGTWLGFEGYASAHEAENRWAWLEEGDSTVTESEERSAMVSLSGLGGVSLATQQSELSLATHALTLEGDPNQEGAQYPYFEVLNGEGERAFYLGWGLQEDHVDFAMENGNDLEISGGNVAIDGDLNVTGDLSLSGNTNFANGFISASGGIVSSNHSAVGWAHNLLFNATNRYTVTQQPSGTETLFPFPESFFNGQLNQHYSLNNVMPTPEAPWVLQIDGLPDIHTQSGAWFGFSSRYHYAPKSFVVEGYDVYDDFNNWRELVSVTDHDGGDYLFKIPTALMGGYTSLRFTVTEPMFQSNFGFSQIFFIHPEATRAYEGLLPRNMWEVEERVGIGTDDPSVKLDVRGNVQIGDGEPATSYNLTLHPDANNLNIRNTNANKSLNLDYPASGGTLNIRTHDGDAHTTRISVDSAGTITASGNISANNTPKPFWSYHPGTDFIHSEDWETIPFTTVFPDIQFTSGGAGISGMGVYDCVMWTSNQTGSEAWRFTAHRQISHVDENGNDITGRPVYITNLYQTVPTRGNCGDSLQSVTTTGFDYRPSSCNQTVKVTCSYLTPW